MNHTPRGAQDASAGSGTGTPAGEPAGPAGAASAPGGAGPAPAALLAVDAAGEVLAAWTPREPYRDVAATPADLAMLAASGGCDQADPARWQVYDLALHADAQPATGTRTAASWVHYHDAEPDRPCTCATPGTHALRRDPALAAFGTGPAGHRARMAAAGFPDFPLHLDAEDGDDPAQPWRLALPGGTRRDFPDWAEAAKAVTGLPGPFAFYQRQEDTGAWHRTELIRGDSRSQIPVELPAGPGDDPDLPWRVIGPNSSGDYANRTIAYTVLREMPAGPVCVYQQKRGGGWSRYEVCSSPQDAR